jgi:hypothetical protein
MTITRLSFVLLVALAGKWIPAAADPKPGLKFIQNKRQWPSSIQSMAAIPGGQLLLQPGAFSYCFLDQRKLEDLHDQHHSKSSEIDQENLLREQVSGQLIRAAFLGSNVGACPVPFGEYSEYYNYFLGKDSSTWSANVHAYQGIVYGNFYEGVNLKMYSHGENLKYDFVVSPGADVSLIRWQYQGADEVYLRNGDLVVHTAVAEIIEKKPVIYQLINGEKIFVDGSFELIDGTISFCMEEPYDPCYELVIDPLLIFSTYSGSSADNWGSTATPGERGTLYSSGVTNRVGGGFFPTTPGAFQTAYGGLYDVAIMKYDSTGSQLLYASYLGGSESESPHSLVMTANEELLVLGTTSSLNFPTTATAFDRTYNGGTLQSNVITYTNGTDIFVARISKTGNQLVASTYLGGSLNDGTNPTNSPLVRNYGDQLRGDIISSADGSVFISTVTSSLDFPMINGFDLTFNGGSTDGVIVKLTSDLSGILWASYLGGAQVDASHTIKIDKLGDLFVAGGTTSADFPVTTGSYQSIHAGNVDGWIAKISGNGSAILKSTFTGTSLFNQVYFLDLDQQENVYAYGQTQGAFPTTANVYRNPNSGQFLQKFNNDLSVLIFSTVFGSGTGTPNISPTAFLVNDCNNIYLSGWGGITNSASGFWPSNTFNMAVTTDAFQRTTSGSDFYLMVLSGDATQLLYATYLGGTTSRTHVDGGTSRFDKGGVVYHAVCAGCAAGNGANQPTSDFPTTPNAFSRLNGSQNCNNAAFKFDLSTLKAKLQTNSKQLNKPGLNKICIGDTIVFQNQSIGGQIYFWDFGDGTKVTKTDRVNIAYKYKSTGTYTVKLKAVDAGTCLGKDSTKTTVLVSNYLGVVGPDLVMCTDAGAQLQASGGVSYLWRATDKSFTSTQPTPFVNPKATTNYLAFVTDVNGCTKKDTVAVRVVPGIDLKFTAERVDYDCFNRPSVKVVNQTDPVEEVFFDFGDGNTSDLPAAFHSYYADGVYSVRLVGKREFCVYDEEIKVPIFELKVPNVFTPDQSSGFNDSFEISYGGRPISQAGIEVSIVIYNRWGGKVYESKNYQGDWTAKEVPAGTYYYEAIVVGETTCKGWVQVVK